MSITILPSPVNGDTTAPPSKSLMQRACACALIRKGQVVIRNPGRSDDELASIRVTGELGARCELKDHELHIQSDGIRVSGGEIHCGESGLGVRMFTPLAALTGREITIHGEGSLLNRPMDFFETVLPQLQVKVSATEGKLPLRIKGPLQPGNITIDGSISSQFLTGLLMAYSAAGAEDASITVHNLKSKPYTDLTLEIMKDFGLHTPENRNYETFHFGKKKTAGAPGTITYQVEGDWSGAAFFLVAGAIAGKMTVKGINAFSKQADKAVLQALMDSGCSLSIREDQVEAAAAPLKAFHFDATDCPDLFPPLTALAACCKGTSAINGVHRLIHKESNRALALRETFGAMGIGIDIQDDLMIIHGGTGIRSAVVSSHHDHRIAMACAVAALKADGPVTIEDEQAVTKSYPDFFEHLKHSQHTAHANL